MLTTIRRAAREAKRRLTTQLELARYKNLLANAADVHAEKRANNYGQPSVGLKELRFKSGRVFSLRDGPSGALMFDEIFLNDLYPRRLLRDVRTVIDVGANVGLFSYYARLHAPQAKIFAFEADPSTFSLLSSNVTGLGIECSNVAAASENGEISFFSSEVSGWSSLFQSRGASTATKVTVPAIKLSEALKDTAVIDLLKVDVEGAEYDILVGDKALWNRRINALAVEVDRNPRDQRYRFSDMMDLLRSRFSSVTEASGHAEYPVFVCQR
jgi:FkbM family methyltransferase